MAEAQGFVASKPVGVQLGHLKGHDRHLWHED